MFGRMFDWFRTPVTEVPDDIAVCEFECAKSECRLGDWQCCSRRLQGCSTQEREQDDHTP